MTGPTSRPHDQYDREKDWQDRYRISSRPKPKKRPSERGHGPCICKRDHYRNDCPEVNMNKKEDKKKTRKPDGKERKKLYKMSAQGPQGDGDASVPSKSDNSPSEPEYANDQFSSHFTVIKRTMLSFVHSTITPQTNLQIHELPRAPSVGRGLSWLNGDLMPIEVWFNMSPTTDRYSVTGCADSGGQCLIKEAVLKKELGKTTVNSPPSVTLSFNGIGGATAKPIGYMTILVYMPDATALSGGVG